uniref:Uncharacterized protein n=1 Tax=Octopus bimaculoides TaxID=37653 RepID=A0A0L8HDS5_OCTBM
MRNIDWSRLKQRPSCSFLGLPVGVTWHICQNKPVLAVGWHQSELDTDDNKFYVRTPPADCIRTWGAAFLLERKNI